MPKNAICIHEEDYGILWKHMDWRTNQTEVRRSRRLVVSMIATVVLVWIVPGRIFLIGMIGCHPEMLGDKVRTAGDTGLRVGEGNSILARQQLVGNWLAHRVE